MSDVAVRLDKNAIVLFNRKDGTKIRLAVGPYKKARRPELVDIKITDWCPMMCTFCLDPDTEVTLDTLRRVPIKELIPGDKLLGFPDPDNTTTPYRGEVTEVKAVWRTRKDAFRFTFSDGTSIISGIDHRFLTSRLGWKYAWELREGSRIRNIPTTQTMRETPDYKVGYLAGYSRGDGAFKQGDTGGNGRWVRLSCTDYAVVQRIHEYLDELRLEPQPIKTLHAPEGSLTCWAVEKRSKAAVDWFEQARDTSIPRPEDYKRGFVAGMYDSDGSFGKGRAIRFYQKTDMEALDYVTGVLCSLDFPLGTITLNDVGVKTVPISSTFEVVERFLNTFTPAHTRRDRLDPATTKKLGAFSFLEITKMEYLGGRDLVDIETGTGTFFANGLATHNCYQASTLNGRHASMDNMSVVATRLGKAGVFEVALGGGEPTGHLEFVEILQMFRDEGIVPNFTTKMPSAVRKLWPEIKGLIGGFAYSAEDVPQIVSANNHFKMADIPSDKVALHYVMGLGDREHFKEYLKAAHYFSYRVTLLGYKTVGRGGDVVPHPYGWWMDVVSELVAEGRCPDLSIDTPLAEQYDGQMPVEKYMYHTREGAFSMYIDAVSMEMGASSFERGDSLVPFDKDWKKRYARI